MAKNELSDELLAAYLDGCTNEAETLQVLKAIKTDPEIREVLDIALQLEDKKYWATVQKDKERTAATLTARANPVSCEKKNNRLRKPRSPRQTPGKNLGLMTD